MESIIVKLKPKSQIQKKPEQKKHGDNHGGAKRLMQDIGNDIGNDRNQFGRTYQIQQQEQFQQNQLRQRLEQLQQYYEIETATQQTWSPNKQVNYRC